MNKLLNLINTANIKIALKYLQTNGFKKFIKQIRLYTSSDKSNYNCYIKQNRIDSKTFALQKSTIFPNQPSFYIVYPFDDINHINLLVEALKKQSYQKWTLLLPATLRDAFPQNDLKTEINLCYFKNTDFLLTEKDTPDYIVFFNKNAIPTPDFLFEITDTINNNISNFMYFDEDIISRQQKFSNPHFKSDYNYDMLMQYNYIGYTFCISFHSAKQIFMITKSSLDDLLDDFILFAKNYCGNITHISKVIVHNRDNYIEENIQKYLKSITRYFKYYSIHANIQPVDNKYLKISYELTGNPLISIIIPNKDHIDELSKCINSILQSNYNNYEIIIVENNSTNEETFLYYQKISKYDNIKVIVWDKTFNYSAINNYASAYSKGEYLLFLNNDTEVITPDWIEEMLMYAQRKDVGIVGSLLLYPDDTIQHAGVILGIQGVAGHSHKNIPAPSCGYFNRIVLTQNYSCITAACMMIKKEIFQKVRGFDEDFKVAFNDIDLCLKVRQQNYLIVYTPYSKLYHYESKSRGIEDTPEKIERFQSEIKLFRQKWQFMLDKGDPYYNKNLTLLYEDFSLKRKIEYRDDFSFY